MNETNFATYDSYFSSTNYQVNDNTLLQCMDYDAPPQNHYLNNTSCDLVSTSTSVDQRLGQTNIFPFLSQTREEQDRIKDPATNLRVTTNSGVSAGSAPGVFGNIPFVQIHTTDVQPQRTSYGNVFRRNISRQEEIKSELIKSEGAEATKDRTNATPTPPRAPSATQSSQSEDARTVTTECQNNDIGTMKSAEDNMPCVERIESEESSNKDIFHVYKCCKCPYISLKEDARDEHEAAQHAMEESTEIIERTEIKCPGCKNTFFVQRSLEVHLKLDHLMLDDEVSKLVQCLVKIKPSESQDTAKEPCGNQHLRSEDNVNKPTQRKSRIYLKNVECLREPNRQPIEQTENQLSGNNNNNNVTQNQNSKAPKQKISIKSVDVLREPALLRRDYELENVNFNLFLHDSESLNNQIAALNVPTTYDEYIQNGDSLLVNTCNINNNDANLVISTVGSGTEIEKQRRPKIYVKSVESFNLMSMPLDPMNSTNADFMGDHNNLCSSTPQGYDSNLVHLPYVYESNASAPNNASYINSHTDMDTNYQLVNNSAQNGNYILENTLYVTTNVEDININGDQIENETLITEPTPPPPSNPVNVGDVVHFTNKSFPANQEQRGTLHLRTVDELNLMNENDIQHPSNVGDITHFNTNKSFLPNQEQRGTLHLRTVDELNLMNENEVQHLIAPNLDNNHNSETIANHISLNGVNLIGDAIYETETFKFQDLDSQMANDWPETYEDLAEDINGIITDVTNNNNNDDNASYSIENRHKNSSIDIDTPQVSLITIRDIEELTGGTAVMADTQFTSYVNDNSPQELSIDIETNVTADQMENVSIAHETNLNTASPTDDTTGNLKRELSNATPDSEDSSTLKNVCDNDIPIMNAEPINKTLSSITEGPRSPRKSGICSRIDSNQPRPSINTHINNNTSAATIPTAELQPITPNTESSSKLLSSVEESQGSSLCDSMQHRQHRQKSTKLSHKQTSTVATIASELPPLVPVTNSIVISPTPSSQNISVPPAPNDIPMPPLVPVPPLIKINIASAKTSIIISAPVDKPPSTDSAPVEKGRIYVANNLMELPKKPVAVTAICGTSVRGRPFGSNRTRITQLKQQHGSSAEDLFVKCTLKGCAFRFKKNDTLEYHQKCHDISSSNPQATICPECRSTEFNNWNTLHTHLWRAHQIDMELYKCELCDFKTPIFSRLVNTHAKIHFDDRNYKCEQCGKGFKNSKQLKNHRRWHRVQASNVATPKEPPSKIHRCADCGSTFSHHSSLRDHCCKNSETPVKCDICQKLMSTKASLKLHMMTHSDVEKRFKCQHVPCDYATNDHNAFRRHRMGHDNKKMYDCQFCEYKSVQSVTYQKHIRHKHPDKVDTVIHKCNDCPFTTINRSLLFVHQAKHHNQTNEEISETNSQKESSLVNAIETSIVVVPSDVQKSKIKVKSNLFTL